MTLADYFILALGGILLKTETELDVVVGRLFVIKRALAEFLGLSKLLLGQIFRTDALLY